MTDEDHPTDELNPRQIRFCQEYIVDLNATQAYIRAGYEAVSADSNSIRLLRGNDRVKAYIAQLQEERAIRTRITADSVLVTLDAMRRTTVKDLFEDGDRMRRISDLTDEAAMSIAGIKFTQTRSPSSDTENPQYDDVIDVKMVDRKGVTELLGKHLNLFTDRKEIVHDGSAEVRVIEVPAKAKLPE